MPEIVHGRPRVSRRPRLERCRGGDQRYLNGLTDLFITSQEGYSAEQIRVFDDLLIHVTKQIESEALIELSIRLAPQPKAPPNTIIAAVNCRMDPG